MLHTLAHTGVVPYYFRGFYHAENMQTLAEKDMKQVRG